MSAASRTPSLRRRLLVATVVVLVLALVPAGWLLGGLFREHVTQQFRETLQVQLDQLAAATQFGADGDPVVDNARMTDPGWQRPLSGLYWQVDGPDRSAALRSRSLWDVNLALPSDTLADGAVHVHEVSGPQGQPLMVLERSIHDAAQPQRVWRLAVARSTDALQAAVARFRTQLAWSLLVLFGLLAAASWVQVTVGLAPLRALREALDAVRANRATRLQGSFPQELQPLVDDFNEVLAQNAVVVERARQHAGNLAHALKTPLTVLSQSADQLARQADPQTVARVMAEQVEAARRHVDWHLARSRAAAQLRVSGTGIEVLPVLDGLIRVMHRVHAARGIAIELPTIGRPGSDPPWRFAGEAQDLQEMLGNLLDNACKWARSRVTVRIDGVTNEGRPQLRIVVEDDGPGVAADQLANLPDRGVRLDESVPGAGLGLAIVQTLAQDYGGRLELRAASAGGLAATLFLPA
ncbi:sensor histidine kinase [Caenimonas sp. SL110]|uniref:sensor histidine kinase n=1 Tax=Caenimonas sp. SL110 TaxID=1450524 RepID=UPI0006528819|nr:sensor histidine kinase [Caenimonas sp. SL110]